MDWLNPGFIGSLTPGTALLVMVLLLATGQIRPKSNISEIRADRDARLAEAYKQAMEWREAYQLSEKAREANAETFREALEIARTANAALMGFREAATRVAIEQDNEGTHE